MFKNYIAQKKDIEAVENALGLVMRPQMKFIFSDLSRIKKTLSISYDSKFIYIWKIDPVKLINKIPHKVIVPDQWQSGWWASLAFQKLEKYLPQEIRKSTRFEIPIICGGLLTPFITLQKVKNLPDNPYTTRESYLATMIHEFGHVYWNSYKLWWPSVKEKNISLLEEAKKLYANKITNKKFNTGYPSPIYASEIFAHCTEYYASETFWPKYKKNFDKFAASQINTMVAIEKNKNLDIEDSILEPTKNQHNYSLVVSKFLTTKHPKNWPNLLIKL